MTDRDRAILDQIKATPVLPRHMIRAVELLEQYSERADAEPGGGMMAVIFGMKGEGLTLMETMALTYRMDAFCDLVKKGQGGALAIPVLHAEHALVNENLIIGAALAKLVERPDGRLEFDPESLAHETKFAQVPI